MSSTARPISPTRFASALASLPLETLHSTAAEIRNSQTHLRASNAQLAPLAAAGDADCADALDENAAVLRRMDARLGLLRHEVERRGMVWPGWLAIGAGAGEGEGEGEGENAIGANAVDEDLGGGEGGDGRGVVTDGVVGDGRNGQGEAIHPTHAPAQNGRLTDEELRRRLEARMREHEGADGDGEGGVHL